MSIGVRNQRIDLIRGVSILLVLLNHFNIAYRLDDTMLAQLLGWEAVRAVVRNGNYGVTLFFVVSGYLITSNADRRWAGLANVHARTFYGFRAARIIPCLLLLVTAVNLLGLGGMALFRNHAEHGQTPPLWLVDLAALTFWMNVLIGRYGWVNYALGILWSLSVEEVFYLSFPILCRVLRNERQLLAFLVAVIVAGPLYRLAHQGNEAGFLYAYFASFDGIAIGCCAALLAKRVDLRGRAASAMVACTAAGMAVLYLSGSIGQTNILGMTAMGLGSGLLLLAAHRQPTSTVIDRSRLLKGLGWLGRLSYELYLFHLVVLGAMRTIVPSRSAAGDTKLLLLVAFLLLSALLGALVARWYAEPLNRHIRQVLSREPITPIP